MQSETQHRQLPKEIYVALLGVFLFALGLTMLIPIIPLFITEGLGASKQWIGTATMLVALTAVITRIPGGALSDHVGRRRVMLIGAVLAIMAAALYLLSQHIVIFLAARLFSGLSLGLYTTANKALVADLAPPARRGEAMGLTNAAFSLSQVVSPLLGEGLKNAISFQAVFALSGALGVLALAISYTLPRTKPSRDPAASPRRNIQSTLGARGMWAAVLLMMGLGAILALMFTFYPQIAADKALFADAPRLIAPVAMGLGLSIWAITDTVIEPIAGRISDRIGRQPVVIPGLILALFGVLTLSRADNTLDTYLAIALMTTGWGTARASADSIAQDTVPPLLRGMGAAVLYTGFDLAVGVNAQVLSLLIEGIDYSMVFQAVIALVLIFGLAGTVLSTRLLAYEERVVSASGD
jgi:MFS family permease